MKEKAVIYKLQQEIKEQQTLLKLTEKVSQLRTFPAFLTFVVEELKPIFDFHDAGIFLLSEDEKTHYDLTTIYPQISPSTANLYQHKKYKNQFHKHNKSAIAYMMHTVNKAERPVLFDFKDLKEQFPEYPQFRTMDVEKSGRRDCLGYHFQIGEKVFGYFCINKLQKHFFKKEHFLLFKKVTDQLAIALDNISANEKMQRRKKQRDQLLQITNGLNQESEWRNRIIHIPLALQDTIDCSLFCFYLQPKAQKPIFYTFERIGQKEYRDWDLKSFSDFIQYENDGAIQLSNLSTPHLIREIKSANIVKNNAFLSRLTQKFSIKSLLFQPFKTENEDRIWLMFLSRQQDAYPAHSLEISDTLLRNFQLTLEKLIAFESIKKLSNQLKLEKSYLEEEFYQTANFGEIIGSSPAMKKVYSDISKVSTLDITVLICGETGTGKELVARAIHKNSKRKNKILVKVNCAAIPEEMMESELFGHTKGAFTGAVKERIGKFELANQGTIFLDEVGELPLNLQAKLLRVLQEKEVERLGGNTVRKIDFRIIAATNRNLELAVKAGTFRADLYYRLFIFPIILPPLRERGKDVLEIAEYIAQHLSKKSGFIFKGFSEQAKERMLNYDWPGNIRELENVIQQDLVRNRNEKIDLQTLTTPNNPFQRNTNSHINETLIQHLQLSEDFTLNDIDEKKLALEKQLILQVLEKTNWRVSGRHGAAALLDVKAVTLEYRMKKLGINRHKRV